MKNGQKKRKNGAVSTRVLAVTITKLNHVIIGNGLQKTQNFVLMILHVRKVKLV